LQDAVELMRTDALPGATHQVERLYHLVKRNAAMLENRCDLCGELLSTLLLIALPEADPRGTLAAGAGLVLKLGSAPYRTAVRADWAVEPEGLFEVLESRFFVLERLAGNDRDG
jgi:hypothetical protein